jgi:lysophospholipase L1-like esterase
MKWLAALLLPLALLTLAVACDEEEEEAARAAPSPAAAATATPLVTPSPEATPTPAQTQVQRLASPAPSLPPVYIALGDSLAAGAGASDPSSRAYVPLFHEYLGEALGIADLALMNLGHGGDTSTDLIEHGHLAKAVDEIRARNFDESPDNDVQVVTLDIGGNDLLGLFEGLVMPGTCPDAETSIAKAECLNALQDALDGLSENFDQALDELEQADPGLPVLTADLYNPFSGSGLPFEELAELALEGREGSPFEEGLNDVIRSIADEHGVAVADWYGPFQGKSAEFMAPDRIHANDAGYSVMADALIAAYEATAD